MKFTKISSDKAYKIYKEGHGEKLYLKLFEPPFGYIKLYKLLIRNDVDLPTREFFRNSEAYIGEELPKFTFRQKIVCDITYDENTRHKIHDMIVFEATGKHLKDYPLSHKFDSKVKQYSWNADCNQVKYILFDVDSEGNKSNFRFE